MDSVVFFLTSTDCADSVGRRVPQVMLVPLVLQAQWVRWVPWVVWVIFVVCVRSTGFQVRRRECFAHIFRSNARVLQFPESMHEDPGASLSAHEC